SAALQQASAIISSAMKLIRIILLLSAISVSLLVGFAFGRVFDFYSIVYELPPGRNVVASAKRVLSLQPSYAQFQQDVWVSLTSGSGRNGGYYVDVGSADGVQISNTYVLDKAGWKGICI